MLGDLRLTDDGVVLVGATTVEGNATVMGETTVEGDATVKGKLRVGHEAHVSSVVSGVSNTLSKLTRPPIPEPDPLTMASSRLSDSKPPYDVGNVLFDLRTIVLSLNASNTQLNSIHNAIAVCSWGPGRLDCFIRGKDQHLYHKWFDSGVWFNWEDLGGQLSSSPTAISWGINRIDCFARGLDDHLWHLAYDNGWQPWQYLDGIP